MTMSETGRHLRLLVPGQRDAQPVDGEPGTELELADEDAADLFVPGGELEPRPAGEVEPAIVEGEIVDEPAGPAQRPIPVWSQRLRLPAPVQRAAGSRPAEHVVITAAGFAAWSGRAWDGATLGTYRRQIKAAEATGDRVALGEWIDRRQEAAGRRHDRWMKLPHLTGALLVGAVLAVGGGLLLLLLVAGAAQVSGAASFAGVLHTAARLAAVLLWAAALALVVLLLAGPVVLVVLAWREGQRTGHTPTWLATSADADVDVSIDETTIALALGALRIPEIREYLKKGNPLQFIVPCRADGRGTYAVVRLPLGVSAEEIVQKKREKLAAGLYRQTKEVFPSTGTEAGILNLWIADKGVLAEGAGPYPLLNDGAVDVFKGVPFGKTLRGDELVAPVMSRNTITGGMPGQGKSSSARIIMVGAALDVTAELRIWVPDTNFDFDVFRPRCSRFVMGDGPEHIERIRDDLRELYEEVQRRGQILVDHEVPEVDRRIASAGVGLHPLFGLLEEAHLAIQHEKFGKDISFYLVEIVRLGRKRGIHLIVSTQAPTKDSMPRQVTRNCSNGIAFAVGDHVANDALLGQGAYRAGHRATDLIPGTDIGTAVVKGFVGESRSALAQVYFLSVKKGHDQVSPIIARSIAAIEASGRTVPAPAAVQQRRDLLADVAEVLGDELIPVAKIPALLMRLAPGWAPYRTLTGKDLRAQLDELYGYRVPSTGNRWPVDPATIRAYLADRDMPEDDSE